MCMDIYTHTVFYFKLKMNFIENVALIIFLLFINFHVTFCSFSDNSADFQLVLTEVASHFLR